LLQAYLTRYRIVALSVIRRARDAGVELLAGEAR